MPYNPKSRANLRPRKPGDPPLNQEGKNGRYRRGDLFREWADNNPTDFGDTKITRIQNVWAQVYQDCLDLRPSMRSNRMASQRLFVEQYQGLPVAGLELMGPGGGPIQTSTGPEGKTSEQRAKRRAELLNTAAKRAQEAAVKIAEAATKAAAAAKRASPDDGESG
jgi:hypothetical protein